MEDIIGVIGIRSWMAIRNKRNNKFSLHSAYRHIRKSAWPSAVLEDRNPPQKYGREGIYAYLPEANKEMPDPINAIYGVVELRGAIQQHKNGTLRAEKCRVLRLFMTNRIAKEFDTIKYNVPLTINSTPDLGLKQWVLIHGREILIHNASILNPRKKVEKKLLALSEGKESINLISNTRRF